MHGFFRISSRLHLAFILMTELAKVDGFLSLKEIGTRMSVSDGYLEEIAAALKSAGLIVGKKGPNGGYRLSRKPNKISAAEIVIALEGPLELVDCHGGACPAEHLCGSKRMWDFLREDIRASLENKTLEECVS